VAPYLPLVSTDPALRGLIVGLIQRQARSVLLDPYANAYQVDSLQGPGPHADDSTYTTLFAGTVVSAMTPAIFERKWEVDSLANVLRLSALYYQASGGDLTPFNATWVAAVATILDTFTAQQADTAEEVRWASGEWGGGGGEGLAVPLPVCLQVERCIVSVSPCHTVDRTLAHDPPPMVAAVTHPHPPPPAAPKPPTTC
jgi:hypothetical protein